MTADAAEPDPDRRSGPDLEGPQDFDAGRILVVIPTYNEIENLGPVVDRLRAAVPEAELLVVDDASPDGTGDLADRLAERDEAVHVLHRAGKQGLGVAYLAGFAWAMSAGYDLICEMDADGSHPVESLPDLLAAAGRADLVIGSRWVPGGRVRNWSRLREAMSRAGNLYARIVLGIPVRDATAGFRVFRRTTLDKIALDDVASQGYSFQMDLTWRVLRAGMIVREIPIVFTDRERGVSKMSLSVAAESLVRVTGWALRDRVRDPLLGRASRRRPER